MQSTYFVILTKRIFVYSLCPKCVCVLFLLLLYILYSLKNRTRTGYNPALSQRAKQSELGLQEPRDVNVRLENNYTAKSPQTSFTGTSKQANQTALCVLIMF